VLNVFAGLTRFTDDPIRLFLDDELLNLGRVVQRENDELFAVSSDLLVDRQRKRNPEGAVSVRALAEELVGVVWPELVSQSLNALVHFSKQRFVLGQPTFAGVHRSCIQQGECGLSFGSISGR
jgi:hypothetical protein